MFLKGSGSFVYDEATRTLTSGRVVVAADSVFSNHKARDRHVRDSDFLDADSHPEIVFEATGFETVTENGGRLEGRLKGNLTLLGQTHPVTLEVALNKAATYPFGHRKHTLGISARTTLQRSQWGMSYGVNNGMVGDEVLLSFEFEAQRSGLGGADLGVAVFALLPDVGDGGVDAGIVGTVAQQGAQVVAVLGEQAGVELALGR